MKRVNYPSEEDWRNYYIGILIIVIVVVIVGILMFLPAFNYRIRPTIGTIVEQYKMHQVKKKLEEERVRMGEVMRQHAEQREKEQEVQRKESKQFTQKLIKKQYQKQAQQIEYMRRTIDKMEKSPD